MSGSWEGKTNVHFRQNLILLCFGPGTVLCIFQTQISVAFKRKKTGKKPKTTKTQSWTWVSRLDHRAIISFKQWWSSAHTEVWGIFVSWSLHECKANTQTIRSRWRYFTAMPLHLEYVWKSAGFRNGFASIYSDRTNTTCTASQKAAGEDSCLGLTRKRPYLLAFGRESGKQHKMEAMKEGHIFA